jgi:hypothetical protein
MRSPYGIHHPDSPAWVGLCPFDLSDPAGVERVLECLDVAEELFREFAVVDGKVVRKDAPRHPLP